jgi:hypothetical protein
VGDEGAEGVLERVESGDERVEFSPSGIEDKGLEGDIVVEFAPRRERKSGRDGREAT